MTDPIRERIATEVASFGSKEIAAMFLYPAALIPWGILATVFLLLLPPVSPVPSIAILGAMAVLIFAFDAWWVNTRVENQARRGFWMIHLRQSILFYGMVATGISGFLGFGRLGASLKEGGLTEDERLLFIGLGIVCTLAILVNATILAIVRRRDLTSGSSAPSSPRNPGTS